MLSLSFFLLACTWPVLAQINLYPADLSPSPVNLAATCIEAINATIACDSAMVGLALQDFYGSMNSTIQDSICDVSCNTALSSYRANVVSVCGADTEMNTGYPVTYIGDLVWAYYNLTCLQEDGEYCTDYIANVATSVDTDLTSLNETVLCSSCMLALLQNRQGTAFSGYDASAAVAWAAIQSQCGTTSYPTAVQPPAASPTSLPGYASANTSYTASCLSGNTYAVVSGDTCQAIAHANSVATGTLIILNQILPGCTDIEVGQQLCLPQTCTTYTVASGDTCIQIATAYGLSLQQLRAWNPSINTACTNLLADTDVCVSIPGGTAWNGTTIAGVTPTQTATYATATVPPPGPTPYGTTAQCGKYYEVQTGDYCQLVVLNNTISVDLFAAINPSIDAACDNLVPGYYYCVLPVADWNMTSSSTGPTTVAPPAPTLSGTTSSCYAWHVVVSGDTCYGLEVAYGITLAQFQAWNPSIDDDCTNLYLGEAYCVDGSSS